MRANPRRAVAIGCLASAVAAPSQAQSSSAVGAAPGLPQARRDANTAAVQRRSQGESALAQTASPEVSLSLGVAREHGSGGDRSWSAPFLLEYASGNLYFSFGGGPSWSRSDDRKSRGWGDLSLSAADTFVFGGTAWSLTPTVTVTLPTGGEVGSRLSSQTAELTLGFAPGDRWRFDADVSLGRDGDKPDGASRHRRAGSLKATYTRDKTSYAYLQADRSLRSGSRGLTSSSAGLAFPLPGLAKVSALLGLSHTWTSGQRSSSAEFDLVYAF